MSEAIKVEVGQVWQFGGSQPIPVAVVRPDGSFLCDRGIKFNGPAFSSSGDWVLISPATVKVAADRSGCKAWCGMLAREALRPSGTDRWHHFNDFGGCGQRWCTPACRDAKYPPMGETKPVPIVITSDPAMSPTEVIMRQGAEMLGRIVNLAKPDPAKAPKCTNDYVSCGPPMLRRLKDETQLMCDDCYVALEFAICIRGAQTGTPYTGPERLPKPKMASDSWWPDFAEDVR